MAAQAPPLYYLFPDEQRLTDLLTLNFPDKKELKDLSVKTIKAIARFFAERDLEQGQIPSNLQVMALENGTLTEAILEKIKEVFKKLQQYGSIPYSSVDPKAIDFTKEDLIAIAKQVAFLRSM